MTNDRTQRKTRCHQLVVFCARVVTYVWVLVRVYVRHSLMSEHVLMTRNKVCILVRACVYFNACVRTCVTACVSACVSACVDFCTYINTSRCLMQVTAVTSPATSLSSSPHWSRLLDTNTTDYFKCQHSRVNKLVSSLSTCHLSTLSRRITTVVLHFDIITRVTTFRDVFVLYKVCLINDVTRVDKSQTSSTTYSNFFIAVNPARDASDTPCSRPRLELRLM